MPIFVFKCGKCHRLEEHIFSSARTIVLPACPHCDALIPMERIPTAPRPHMLTGADEKARRGAMICKRNVDYWNSKAGREQYRDDKSGRPDLMQLENTRPSGE